jgi:alkylhydroperoxidase family enzyme
MPNWRVGEQATPYFRALLNSPSFALNRARFSSLIRTAGNRDNSYSHHDRELVDQVLSRLLNSNHVLFMHVGDALSVGVRLEAIEAIRQGNDQGLNSQELLMVRYIREVANGTVMDETFDAVERGLGTRGIVEYTVLITGLMMTILQMQAFRCDEPSDAEVENLIDGFRTGARSVPDFSERIR